MKLKEGCAEIVGKKDGQTATVNLWVDTHKPVIHVDVDTTEPISVQAYYESWRTADRELTARENDNNRSFINAPVNAFLRNPQTLRLYRAGGVAFFWQQPGQVWCETDHPKRLSASYTRTHGIQHWLAFYDVHKKKLWGYMWPRKRHQEFLEVLKLLRKKYPKEQRIHLILDNFSPHR